MSFSFMKVNGELDLDSSNEVCDTHHTSRRIIMNDENSWIIETSAPLDDGYLWRKYGTKKISNSNFPRSYFRCSYKDEKNCHAIKQVQQKDNTDPPLFKVTYKNEHSCNSKPISNPKLSIPTHKNQNLISFDSSKFSNSILPLDHLKSSEMNLNKMDVNFLFESGSSIKSEIIDCGLDGLDKLDGFEAFDDSVIGEYLSSSFDMD